MDDRWFGLGDRGRYPAVLRFRTIHLLSFTAYASVVAALFQCGEPGRSMIPVLTLSCLFTLPAACQWTGCPAFLKIRYHLGFFAILGFPFFSGMFYEYGWWIFPLNALMALFVAPAAILGVQLIKQQYHDQLNIELRITQIIAIWLPITMSVTARFFGTMMSLV